MFPREISTKDEIFGNAILISESLNREPSTSIYYNFRLKSDKRKEWTFKQSTNIKHKATKKSINSVFINSGVQEHIERQMEAIQERIDKQRLIEKGRTITPFYIIPWIKSKYYNIKRDN